MSNDRTSERLLIEARDLYLEVGPERFSLREVARRVGVSATAVYRHYDSKEALFDAVAAEGFRIFATYLLKALSASGARARLMESARQYLAFAVEHPRDYRVIFMGDARPPATSNERAPTFQFLVDRVRECMDEGVLRGGDADEIATIIWGHVHGLASLRLSGHLRRVGAEAQFKKFFESAAERLIWGLGP